MTLVELVMDIDGEPMETVGGVVNSLTVVSLPVEERFLSVEVVKLWTWPASMCGIIVPSLVVVAA